MKYPKCGKNFSYSLVGTVYPGGKERENIHCPYCDFICESVITSQFVETIKNNDELKSPKGAKDLLTEQESEMIDDLTEGQLAEYLAENLSDY